MEKEISVDLVSDEKGYLDRQCPNDNCLSIFKVKMSDWKNRIVGNNCYCPICGHIDNSDSWWTNNQIREMRERAVSYALGEIQSSLDKTFKKMERATQKNKSVKIKFKPGKRISFNNNPIGQSKEWEQEISCKECGFKYSVVGFSHFCPCCGCNSEIYEFQEALKCERRKIDSLSEMEELFNSKYGEDYAREMTTSMLEDSLEKTVSAFQSFTYEYYKKISGNEKINVRKFQILDEASTLFEKTISVKFIDLIGIDDYRFISRIFQQRHLLEHKNGKVDKKYLDKTMDSSYSEKQRIVIKKADVYEMLDIVEKLINALIDKVEK